MTSMYRTITDTNRAEIGEDSRQLSARDEDGQSSSHVVRRFEQLNPTKPRDEEESVIETLTHSIQNFFQCLSHFFIPPCRLQRLHHQPIQPMQMLLARSAPIQDC